MCLWWAYFEALLVGGLPRIGRSKNREIFLGLTAINILISATVIGFCTWLAGKRTDLAGLLVALPLTSMLALALTQARYSDQAMSVRYAKDIFIAVPLSLLFFVPFLLAERFSMSFLQCYILGTVLLVAGYLASIYAK